MIRLTGNRASLLRRIAIRLDSNQSQNLECARVESKLTKWVLLLLRHAPFLLQPPAEAAVTDIDLTAKHERTTAHDGVDAGLPAGTYRFL